MIIFRSAPTGLEIDFGIIPRTALRLSWAIIRRPSGANITLTRSSKP